MSFKEREILKSYDTKRISKDHRKDPVLFYRNVFSEAVKADFHLGYFSTNAIINIAFSFASFIRKGGVVRFITNQYLNSNDIGLLGEFDLEQSQLKEVKETYQDAEALSNTFKSVSQHFFDCLKYLIAEEKLLIIPVICKSNIGKSNEEMSHYKIAFFYDEDGNWIYSTGSSNFSFGGMVRNGEKIDVTRSWTDFIRTEVKEDNDNKEEEGEGIMEDQLRINDIINDEEDEFQKLAKESLIEVIGKRGKSKDLDQLALDAREIQNEIKKLYKSGRNDLFKDYPIKEVEREPKFPFDEPRQYQKDAYNAWVKNDYNGLFAMATGTGKTITSLNCVLNEYNIHSKYNVIIAVPTRSLVSQWVGESKRFNLSNIITTSDYKYKETLKRNLITENNLVLITTYATISRGSLDQIFLEFEDEFGDFIFISDECHNIGSEKLFNKIPKVFKKRIGLSATPERKYDEKGSNNLFSYFNSFPPCFTYSYSMKRAIDKGVLSEFNYYPKFTSLEEDELKEYIAITKKIARFLIPNSGKNPDWVNMELIKRKRIINKARNKKILLKKIVTEIENDNSKPDFNFAFVYVPEGYENNLDYDLDDDDLYDLKAEDRRIMDDYCLILGDEMGFKVQKFLGETRSKDSVLQQFKDGKMDALLAMKCLDEGVDIPRTQYGIFCASSGNPRQYIQRRGRVLRTHDEKKLSYIYDMIVVPDLNRLSTIYDKELYSAEVNIFKNEILRSINFIALSNNLTDILSGDFYDLCRDFDIDLSIEINKELENYNKCN